jgi:hypothetical protein
MLTDVKYMVGDGKTYGFFTHASVVYERVFFSPTTSFLPKRLGKFFWIKKNDKVRRNSLNPEKLFPKKFFI